MDDETRVELRTWAGLILVVGGLVWLTSGWLFEVGDDPAPGKGLVGLGLVAVICAGGFLLLQNPGLFAVVRIAGYVAVVIGGFFLTLGVVEGYFGEHCGASDCELAFLSDLLWSAVALFVLTVAAVLIEMTRRKTDRAARTAA